MALLDDEIRRLALETAERIFGEENVDSLDVSAGSDWSGASSYFLEFVVEQRTDRQAAVDDRLKLRRDIRDKLAAAGDETYPYVRVHDRELAPVGG